MAAAWRRPVRPTCHGPALSRRSAPPAGPAAAPLRHQPLLTRTKPDFQPRVTIRRTCGPHSVRAPRNIMKASRHVEKTRWLPGKTRSDLKKTRSDLVSLKSDLVLPPRLRPHPWRPGAATGRHSAARARRFGPVIPQPGTPVCAMRHTDEGRHAPCAYLPSSVIPLGFEPKTHALEGRCSNPTELRNRHIAAPGRTMQVQKYEISGLLQTYSPIF